MRKPERFNVVRETRTESGIWLPESQLLVTFSREEIALMLTAVASMEGTANRNVAPKLVDISRKLTQTLI